MKKIYLTLITLLSVYQFTYAQWTTGPGNINNTNTGNIGIGTTTPTSLLTIGSTTIRGTMNISGSTTAAPAISITDNQAGGRAYTLYSGLSGAGNFDVLDQVSGHFRFMINPLGNVGIGTIIPITTLDVDNAASAQLRLATTATGNTSNIEIYNSSNYNYGVIGVVSGTGVSTGDVYALGYANNNNSTFTNVLNWLSNGNVGIGTSAPGSYKLAVAGNIHAQQVNVDLSGWSDYVFDKGYHLPSLTETAAYIDKNHHLSEIPSAAEITKNGLDLGEMNKLLLKKVEELTLYLIEKDKQVNEQQKTNQSFKEQLDDLKAQLKAAGAKTN